MTDDRDPSSLPFEELAQLRERARVVAAHTRELIEAARAAQAHAASLAAEAALVLDEVQFRQMARRKVDPFP
jgi:hypothetical protein